ncbi:MAG: tyrosine-type recombinase/integrase [Endozoicomonas sp.]|uniref:tyrosine-type recombinase/integrase n=1 Tax=Endozoicomonas sp. TaxID=1892382 RepID=UPI003D9B10B8
MAKKNLTDVAIRNKKPESKETTMVDMSGLICRIFPSGRKAFCWRYMDHHRNRQQSRIEYGDYPDRSLEDARRIHLSAKSAKSARKNGQDIKDPSVLNQIIKEVVKDSANFVPLLKEYTLSDLVADYFKGHIEKNNIGPRPYNRIKKHVEPVLGHYSADHVPAEEIKQLITHLRDNNQKDRTIFDTVRFTVSMYRWGIAHFKCKTNPFEPYSIKAKRKIRTSYYPMHELRTLLTNPEDFPIKKDFYLMQKALILSGTRRTQVLEAEINEFNFENGNWTIPPERVKNQNMLKDDEEKVPFIIPMSTQLMATVQEAISLFGNDRHVFGSKRTLFIDKQWQRVKGGSSSPRHYNYEIKAFREHYGITNRTNHDLRRTLETNLTNLGVSESITTAMTGHSRKGMSKTYNQAKQIHVLRTAFQMWADFIDFICEKDQTYAIYFEEQRPSHELKDIYTTFKFNDRIIDTFSIFEGR